MPEPTTRFLIQIPVIPYVRKYILFFNEWQDPILVSRAKFPASVLFNLLERNYYRYDDLRAQYPATLAFSINAFYAQWMGQSLSPDNVVTLNNVFKGMFYQELYACMDMVELENEKVRQRGSRTERSNLIIKDAIEAMAEKYCLAEDDYSYETFRKRLFRYRKNKEGKRRADYLRF